MVIDVEPMKLPDGTLLVVERADYPGMMGIRHLRPTSPGFKGLAQGALDATDHRWAVEMAHQEVTGRLRNGSRLDGTLEAFDRRNLVLVIRGPRRSRAVTIGELAHLRTTVEMPRGDLLSALSA